MSRPHITHLHLPTLHTLHTSKLFGIGGGGGWFAFNAAVMAGIIVDIMLLVSVSMYPEIKLK